MVRPLPIAPIMKRRDFLTVAGAAGVTAAMTNNAKAQTRRAERRPARPVKREFIELRQYRVKNDDKKKLLVEILDTAFIPALKTQGVGPVGVFVSHPSEEHFKDAVFVLIPHATAESFMNLTPKLLANKKFREAAAPAFLTTSKDPVYETYQSTLMFGFQKCPKVEAPDLGKDRLFQLRYYRSFNLDRNTWKVHMFDEGGELPLFRECAMHPIFFGETIFGDRMPNLTYMLGFENNESRESAWKKFVGRPEWQKMKADPLYKDTATEITNIVLSPSDGSEI